MTSDPLATAFFFIFLSVWLYAIGALGWYAAKGTWAKNPFRITACTLLAWLMGGLFIGIPVMAVGWILQRRRQKTHGV